MRGTTRKISIPGAAFILATTLAACSATRGAVVEDTRQVEEELERVEIAAPEAAASLEQQEAEAIELAAAAGDRDSDIRETAALAHQALERARRADALAGGRPAAEIVYTIDDIRFAPGTAELNRSSRAVLDQLADRLELEDSEFHLEIQGHTDASGSERANLEMSRERAQAVESYLREQGLTAHRLEIVPYGSIAPAADNRTPAGRSANRRVVVVVLR